MATADKKYKCERCGHPTSTKSNLLQHLRKKTPCIANNSQRSREVIINELLEPIVDNNSDKNFKCDYCNKRLSSAPGKSQHKKICPKRPELLMETMIKNLQEELNKNKNDIIDLREQLMKNNTTTIMNTNHIHNQHNNNNINIIVNNFGNETTPMFTPEFLNHCLLNPSKGLTSLIEKIHYNPELPENYNLRHKSTKQNTLQKFIDHNWHDCDASNTLDELIRKGYRILNTYYSENVENNPSIIEDEVKAQIYGKFRFLGDKKSLEYSAVKRDLRLLVKDRTIFLLASQGTQLNADEIEEIQSEIVGALTYV